VPDIHIRPFQPEDALAFRDLNEDWIKKYFHLEDEDRLVLGDPHGHILAPGGHIFMALSDNLPVGCCALIPMKPGVFELGKMAVAEEYRGRGIEPSLYSSEAIPGLPMPSIFMNRSASAIFLLKAFLPRPMCGRTSLWNCLYRRR
jgi:predicted N-acetyltransferase YhbS